MKKKNRKRKRRLSEADESRIGVRRELEVLRKWGVIGKAKPVGMIMGTPTKKTTEGQNIRKRLLRRWKGTALEVRTLCWGPMQRDDEVGGKEMDSWLWHVARWRFVPAPSFSMEKAPRST